MNIRKHWIEAKEIIDSLLPEIWKATSQKKLKKLSYHETIDFFYSYDPTLEKDSGYIYYRLYRVKKWENEVAICSRSYNSFIDVYISDDLFECKPKLFKAWVQSSLYHETIHALQHHYSVFKDVPFDEKFDVSYSFWDSSPSAQQHNIFLQQTDLFEMDACLGEYWCMHGYLPDTEDKLYERVYKDLKCSIRLAKRIARYVWKYHFLGKKAICKRRIKLFYKNLNYNDI